MNTVSIAGMVYENSYGYNFLDPIGVYEDEFAACEGVLKHRKRNLGYEYVIINMPIGEIPTLGDYSDDYYGTCKNTVSPDVWEWLCVMGDIHTDKDFIRCLTDRERDEILADASERGYRKWVVETAMQERDEFLRTGKLPNR